MYTVYNTLLGTVVEVGADESKLLDNTDIANEVVLTSDVTGTPVVGTTRIVDNTVVAVNWGNVREQRKTELESSDWRDLPSYPGTDQGAWRTYREELRGIPQDYINVEDIVWPVKP